jgi:hypothetical protein
MCFHFYKKPRQASIYKKTRLSEEILFLLLVYKKAIPLFVLIFVPLLRYVVRYDLLERA